MMGSLDYSDPIFQSNMTSIEWGLFDTEDQLAKYRDVFYLENLLENKVMKQ